MPPYITPEQLLGTHSKPPLYYRSSHTDAFSFVCTIQRTTPVSSISGHVGLFIIVSIFRKCPGVLHSHPTHYAAYAQACASHQTHTCTSSKTHLVSSATTYFSKDYTQEPHTSTLLLSSSSHEMFYPAIISNLSPRACPSLKHRMLELDLKKPECIKEVMMHP